MDQTQRSKSLMDAVRRIPKAELHIHLEGSISVRTLIDLADKHGKQLPPEISVDTVFEFNGLDDFIRVASLSFEVMLDAEDFSRVTYEMLAQSAQHGARHVEFFFSPSSHPMLSYADMLRGIELGIERACSKFGMTAAIIPSHNRMLGSEAGAAFLNELIANRSKHVVGIGLEFAELPFPPEAFRDLYKSASEAGLRLTAHAGEDGPSSYVRTCVTELHCDRIDHGYSVIEDPTLTQLCRDRGVWFTCCPTTTRHTTKWKQLSDPNHAIHLMRAAGLNVTVNTDDPGFFQTDLTQEYLALGLPLRTMCELAKASIEAAWIDDARRRLLLDEWRAEVAEVLGTFRASELAQLAG